MAEAGEGPTILTPHKDLDRLRAVVPTREFSLDGIGRGVKNAMWTSKWARTFMFTGLGVSEFQTETMQEVTGLSREKASQLANKFNFINWVNQQKDLPVTAPEQSPELVQPGNLDQIDRAIASLTVDHDANEIALRCKPLEGLMGLGQKVCHSADEARDFLMHPTPNRSVYGGRHLIHGAYQRRKHIRAEDVSQYILQNELDHAKFNLGRGRYIAFVDEDKQGHETIVRFTDDIQGYSLAGDGTQTIAALTAEAPLSKTGKKYLQEAIKNDPNLDPSMVLSDGEKLRLANDQRFPPGEEMMQQLDNALIPLIHRIRQEDQFGKGVRLFCFDVMLGERLSDDPKPGVAVLEYQIPFDVPSYNKTVEQGEEGLKLFRRMVARNIGRRVIGKNGLPF
jgi:hypothetical protein